MTDESRYSRHAGLFGAEGQRRIADARAAIVGVGGIGSHVVQQLAYLGVLSFVLIDSDSVSASNLNRLIGATPEDVGAAKIDVSSRLILTIQPDAHIRTANTSFGSGTSWTDLADVHVVFGCVDTDSARLELVRSASALALPYVDLASDVSPEGEFGGRAFFALDGTRCLSCSGELDPHELARDVMTAEQRAADDRIYGIDRSALEASGPSVVSVNGVVASLAVTEFAAWVTGLREPRGYLNYRADLGTVTARSDPPRSYCHYCMELWGSRRPPARPRSQ
jgi:molybdopterin/thiamine biosynthesis adenylyltransferase